MRRVFAIAGAAALAVAGIAGPASADDASIQALEPQVVEVGANVDDTFQGSSLIGSYVVIENVGTTSGSGHLADYQLRGCNASQDFQIIDYDTESDIGSGNMPFQLTGDFDATPVEPDEDPTMSLPQGTHTAVYLEGPSGLVNGVFWGGAGEPAGCNVSGLIEADNDPQDDLSLHLDSTSPDSWITNSPEPRNTSSTT